MDFEYDINKSIANKKKHDIDFEEAKNLWKDDNRIEIPARIEDENRLLVIAKWKRKYWSAVITPREEKIRIISVRRSRKKEVSIYESKEF